MNTLTLTKLCALYYAAYHAGHHDTVEGQYVDVVHAERHAYHDEAVNEWLADEAEQPE